MLLARSGTRPPLDTALSFAAGLHWPVVPGCDQGRKNRRCGRPDCITGAPHPISGHADLTPTMDETTIRRWWRIGPHAPVLLAPGHTFDLLDVPARAAEAVLENVHSTGYPLGPVAMTGNGRLLIWVRPGARSLVEVHGQGSWPFDTLGLYCRDEGDFALAPPWGGASWIMAPTAYNPRILPHCADILTAVVRGCR